MLKVAEKEGYFHRSLKSVGRSPFSLPRSLLLGLCLSAVTFYDCFTFSICLQSKLLTRSNDHQCWRPNNTSAANAFLVCLEPVAVSGGCKMPFVAAGEANRALSNPLAEFEGPLQGEGKRGVKKGRKGKGRNGGRKHPVKQISGYGLGVRRSFVCVVSRRRATPID